MKRKKKKSWKEKKEMTKKKMMIMKREMERLPSMQIVLRKKEKCNKIEKVEVCTKTNRTIKYSLCKKITKMLPLEVGLCRKGML